MSPYRVEFTAMLAADQISPGRIPGPGTFDVINDDDTSHTINGTQIDDTISGNGGNDTLLGNAGNDTLFGGNDNDTLYGGNGNDTVYGGQGDDRLQGVGSEVILTTDAPCDILVGGQGTDILAINYAGFIDTGTGQPLDVICDITAGSGEVQVGGFRGENFSQIERLSFIGADGNDTVTGADLADTIDGQGGNDVIDAKGGDDIVTDSWGVMDADGGDGTDTIILNRGFSGHGSGDTVINGNLGTVSFGGVSGGTFSNFEKLTVYGGNSSGNLTITGMKTGVNTLQALFGPGNCTFTGGDLNDLMYGGDGNDNLNGGGGNDILQASIGTNVLKGGDGDDTLYGGGLDTLNGGTGNDVINVGAVEGFHVDGGNDNDIVILMEPLASVAGASLAGGGGTDEIQLYFHDTALDFTAATLSGFEKLNFTDHGGIVHPTVTFSTAQFAQFQTIVFTAQTQGLDHISIVLADNANVALPTSSQFHELRLAAGGQHADLGAVTGTVFPTVTGGSGNDTVIAPTVALATAFKANLGDGNDIFTGGASADQAAGEGGNDTLHGGAGNDVLTGGAGADTMDGGADLDTFVYAAVSDSTGSKYDTISHFDARTQDKFDLTFAVAKVERDVNAGALSAGTFNNDLKAAIGKHELKADHAVLFTADSGDLAGKSFLIIDANGKGGYQSNADIVILLDQGAHLGSLDAADFI